MLEGKELEDNIGEYGTYSVDVNDEAVVVASVGLKIDIIKELRKLAKKTSNSLDDSIVDFVEKMIKKKPAA